MDRPEVGRDRRQRRSTLLKPVQLGMRAVAFCLPLQDLLGKQGFTPDSNQALLIQKGGMERPETHRCLVPEEVHVLKPGSCLKQPFTRWQEVNRGHAVLAVDAKKLLVKALVIQFEFLVLAAFFGDVKGQRSLWPAFVGPLGVCLSPSESPCKSYSGRLTTQPLRRGRQLPLARARALISTGIRFVLATVPLPAGVAWQAVHSGTGGRAGQRDRRNLHERPGTTRTLLPLKNITRRTQPGL